MRVKFLKKLWCCIHKDYKLVDSIGNRIGVSKIKTYIICVLRSC